MLIGKSEAAGEGWVVVILRLTVHLLIVMVKRADVELVAVITMLQMGFDRLQFGAENRSG